MSYRWERKYQRQKTPGELEAMDKLFELVRGIDDHHADRDMVGLKRAVLGTKKPKAAFDSANDLLINPDIQEDDDLLINPDYSTSTACTKEEALAELKLAVQSKSPKERARIGRDCKAIERQLHEEQFKAQAADAARQTDNKTQLLCNAANQAYSAAFKKRNNIYIEHHGDEVVRTYRGK